MKNNQPFITTGLREEFERYFDEKYPNVEKWHYDAYVKVSADYWLQKMSEHKERLIKEVEGMKQPVFSNQEDYGFFITKGYNQALEDILRRLQSV